MGKGKDRQKSRLRGSEAATINTGYWWRPPLLQWEDAAEFPLEAKGQLWCALSGSEWGVQFIEELPLRN